MNEIDFSYIKICQSCFLKVSVLLYSFAGKTYHSKHWCDASQITSLMIVYSTVYSDADQIKHQSSASLAFVQGIHRWPVNSPRKWPVTWKMFPFDDIMMMSCHAGFILENKNIIWYFLSFLWDTTVIWNPYLWKAGTCWNKIVKADAADVLVIQGVRSSAAMMLIHLPQNFPFSAL